MPRVLLTGATSFTAEWVIGALSTRHEVFAALSQGAHDYQGSRAQRVDRLGSISTLVPHIRHEDESLENAISELGVDVVVVHAHPMDGFRDADYDVAQAVHQMTSRLESQMRAGLENGTRWLYSGSVYEPTEERPAVSPYGVSKRAVWESMREVAARVGTQASRITIPNPFGPGEEGRIGGYLAAQWRDGNTPVVRTPDYVRDNIPVTELAAWYATMLDSWPTSVLAPSGYQETMGAFVARVAQEVGSRWGRELPFELTTGAPHPEPPSVLNEGPRDPQWAQQEAEFWDDYAEFLSQDPTSVA